MRIAIASDHSGFKYKEQIKTVLIEHGHEVKDFTTVNMDFIQHYRPMTNVVHRPTLDGGKGFSLTGHHEIMFPLLAAAVIEGLDEKQ